jgi:hypothetical protein
LGDLLSNLLRPYFHSASSRSFRMWLFFALWRAEAHGPRATLFVASTLPRRAKQSGKRVIFTVPALSLVDQTVENSTPKASATWVSFKLTMFWPI